MSKMKKNFLTLSLAALLMASFASIASAGRVPPPGYPSITPPPLTEQDKLLRDIALSFLTNVATFNISSYSVEVFVDNNPGPNYDKALNLKFISAESQVDMTCLFREKSLFWCTIYPVKGSPAFTTPKSSDTLSIAKDTLDKLQTFSTKDYLTTLRNMLNTVTELKSSKITTTDFTQEIAVSGSTVTISWEPFNNGLSNPQNKLYLEFENGNLRFFADYLGMFKIGSSEATISEQEAIKIALDHAKAYSWEQDGETVSNVNVLDSPIIANISLQNRGNNTLYPHWDIWLPLDKMYPGGVTAFHIGIWADTGEVAFISPLGYYGAPNTDSSETQTPQATLDYGLSVAIVLIAATIVIASYLFIKRNR
jgi:hypothetical protein